MSRLGKAVNGRSGYRSRAGRASDSGWNWRKQASRGARRRREEPVYSVEGLRIAALRLREEAQTAERQEEPALGQRLWHLAQALDEEASARQAQQEALEADESVDGEL